MKLILSCFIVLFFLIINVEAQESWIAQVSGTTNSLSSVYFVNSTTGWAVGAKGTIRKTSNGGTTWTAQTSGVTVGLHSVYFVDSTTGWVVGDSNTILKTPNGGRNWTNVGTRTNRTLNCVYFINANTGWTSEIYTYSANGFFYADGDVNRTSDGGNSWTTSNLLSGAISYSVTSVYFTDGNKGWAVMANGYIYKTINGGVNWTTQNSQTNNALWSVHFSNDSTGWTVGTNGTIIMTTNSGTNWSVQSKWTTRSLNAVYFVNTDTGWVAGDSGLLGKTTDGGTNWLVQSSGTTNSLSAVHFVNDSIGWAVGSNGIILKHTGNPVPVFSAISHSQNLFQSHSGHISYQLPYPSRVLATVFNLQGQMILKLFEGEQAAGYHELFLPFAQWQGNDFLRFQTDQFQKTLQLGR